VQLYGALMNIKKFNFDIEKHRIMKTDSLLGKNGSHILQETQ